MQPITAKSLDTTAYAAAPDLSPAQNSAPVQPGNPVLWLLGSMYFKHVAMPKPSALLPTIYIRRKNPHSFFGIVKGIPPSRRVQLIRLQLKKSFYLFVCLYMLFQIEMLQGILKKRNPGVNAPGPFYAVSPSAYILSARLYSPRLISLNKYRSPFYTFFKAWRKNFDIQFLE